MKQLTGFLLAFSILGQAFVPAFWVLDYQWRRAVYLKNCENKYDTSLHCAGQCYLRKQMIADANPGGKAPRLPENFFSIKDLNLFCETVETFPLPDVSSGTDCCSAFHYRRHLPIPPAFPVFKPPARV